MKTLKSIEIYRTLTKEGIIFRAFYCKHNSSYIITVMGSRHNTHKNNRELCFLSNMILETDVDMVQYIQFHIDSTFHVDRIKDIPVIERDFVQQIL